MIDEVLNNDSGVVFDGVMSRVMSFCTLPLQESDTRVTDWWNCLKHIKEAVVERDCRLAVTITVQARDNHAKNVSESLPCNQSL